MEWFGNFESDDKVEEIPVSDGDSSVVTFIVTRDGRIFFTRERIRHLALLSRTLCSQNEIAWGGVLTDKGSWIRQSYDFGDAPNSQIRNDVIFKIQKVLFA